MDEAFGLVVPFEAFAGREREIGQEGERGGAVPFLDVGGGPLMALDAVEEVARSRLVEVAVARLDDLSLAAGLRVLERAAALRDDLVAFDGGVRGPEGAAELDLGAAAQHRLAVGLVDTEEGQHPGG